MCLLKYFLLIVFLKYSISAAINAYSTEIELVHVFFRHGERTPEKNYLYPTDPYKDYNFYPAGLGQLTNQGKMREYNLGRFLRNRYDKFLGEIYTPEIIESMSSDYDRTKMSLLLVLAGLWPPKALQEWHPSLLWQPIPFDYQPSATDHFIQRPNNYCPKYLKELKKIIKSSIGKDFVKNNKNAFDYAEKWTQKQMLYPLDMFDLYQTLNAEDSLNLTLPEWTDFIYPEPLQTIAGMQCLFENFNDILKRLNGGHSLKKVIENGAAKIKGELKPKGRKIYLISGHENNVVNVLAAMDLFTAHMPLYGSAVLFELHRIQGTTQYGYKIYYLDQKSSSPLLLKLDGCDEFCPFEEFVSLTSNHVPGNYTVECESKVNLD